MPLNRTPPSSSPSSLHVSEPDLSTKTLELEHNITMRKRKFQEVDEINGFMTEMKKLFSDFERKQNDKYNTLQTSVNELKELNSSIKKSADFVSGKYDDLLKEFSKLTAERKENLAYIQLLEEKVETLERYQKASCLELRNIPTSANESKDELAKIVINTGKALKLHINKTDIKDIYRLKTKSESNKPILINFATVIIKEDLLNSVKNYNKTNSHNRLSTAKLKLEGPDKPIFLSESLTYKAKRLYYLAREFSKTNDFKFCWTTHGRIYIRRKEGANLYPINTESD